MFTHLDKLYWKKEKISKGDLIAYYEAIEPYILPYLKNRPIVLHRFPNGTSGEDFFQKESGKSHPTFIKTVVVKHATKEISYFLIQNLKSLLYVANLGSIELHLFHARIKNLNKPDYLVCDLDPVDISFDIVVDTAQTFREICEECGVHCYCKTSGGRGLHIYIPLQGQYEYSVVKECATLLAKTLHQKLPKYTSLERSPLKRKKRIYIDMLQNQKMQTIVAPYSVRGYPGATVATPLDWKEVKYGLNSKEFTLHTVLKRVQKKGDLFRGLLKKKTNLPKLINKLRRQYD